MGELKLNDNIDVLELALITDGEPIVCPVKHTFTPGFYIREIFMPKGVDGKVNIVTSRVHNTFHPFFVLSRLYKKSAEFLKYLNIKHHI